MQVLHDPAGQRFYVELPGGTALLAYADLGDGVLDFYSTYVPESARGQGLAGQLVEAGLAFAREGGYRVIPSCWYVAGWFRSHPEAADLLAG